ncbi:SHOCT domain-containing protein [Microbacterium sp. A93]|uniref:SHOCT domain-containing protein n=1 Tax=unclassified Microbacterium TaxID=2609290 RepID=UPI003F4322C1
MSFWSAIWDVLLWALTFTVFIAYLMALFSIISDLFRDHKLNGVAKAIWLICLIFLPLLTALAYLIFRGRGMSERAAAQQQAAKNAADSYIRTVAGNPVEDIARAKELLDAGTITADEFAQLKSAALAKS